MYRYLSYKVAQILGSCHVPPVVPVALSPGLPTLVDRGVFKYHHAKSKKTIMRCVSTAVCAMTALCESDQACL